MRVFLGVLGITCGLLLSACSNELSAPNPNAVELFQDDISGKEIRQLRLQFPEAIAIAGALPSPKQIAAIQVHGEHFPGCSWRFLNTETLACELDTPLPLSSEFTLEIAPEFPMLAAQLNSAQTFVITTSPPTALSDLTLGYNDFWVHSDTTKRIIEITAYQYLLRPDTASSGFFEFVIEQLILKRPDGEAEPILWEADENDGYRSWKVTLPIEQEGLYQLQLPAGTLLAGSNQPLAQPLVLHQTRIYDRFQWLGFRCFEEDSENLPWRFDNSNAFAGEGENAAKTAINCPSGSIEMRFSHAFPLTTSLYWDITSIGFPMVDIPWLSAPAAILQRHNSDDESLFVVRVLLLPEQDYELDLMAVWQEYFSETTSESGGSLPAQLAIAEQYKVQAPVDAPITLYSGTFPVDWWPAWFEPRRNWGRQPDAIAQVTDEQTIQATVRYAETLDMQVQAITSAAELQQFLNGARDVSSYRWQLEEQSAGNLYDLPLTEILGRSGALWIEGPDSVPEKPGLVLRNSFNIDVLFVTEWLVFAWDYAGQPLYGVDIYQVCTGENEPALLGKTNAMGFIETSPEWELAEHRDCWLWATRGEEAEVTEAEHASLALQKQVTPNSVPAVTGSLFLAQRVLRPQDTLHVAIELQHRRREILHSDKLSLTLTHSDGREYVIPVTDISAAGLSSASFEFPDAIPNGRYTLVLSYNEQEIARNRVELTEFIPPEMSLSANTNLQLEQPDWWQIEGEFTRTSSAAMMDQEIALDVSFTPTTYIPSKPEWPDKWDFSFRLQEENEAQHFQHDLLLKSDGQGGFRAVANAQVVEQTASKNQGIGFIHQAAPQTQGYLQWAAHSTAVSGESVSDGNRLNIYGLPAYPGLQHGTEGKFKIRLIDAEGDWLSEMFSVELRDDEESARLLVHCDVDVGIADCQFPSELDQVAVWVSVGDVTFERTVYRPEQEKPEAPTLQLPTAFVYSEDVYAADTYPTEREANHNLPANAFTITAATELEALLLVYTDRVQHVRPIQLTPGENTLSMPVSADWGAAATVVLVYQDDSEIAFTSRSVLVQPAEELPLVALNVVNTDISVGDSLQLSISSEQDTDVQLWLVDEGLLMANFAKIPEEESIRSRQSASWQSGFSSYTVHRNVAVNTQPQGWYGSVSNVTSGELETRMRVEGKSYAMDIGEMMLDESSISSQQLVLWQPLVKLQAGETSVIDIELPSRATSWRVIAVTASEHQRQLVNQQFAVQAPFEFSIEAAEYSFVGDTLNLAVTATARADSDYGGSHFERTQQYINENIDILVAGVLHTQLEFQLTPGESQRQVVALPMLSEGEHTVVAQQHSGPQTRALSLNVSSPRIMEQVSTWPDTSESFLWQLPKTEHAVDFYQISGEPQLDWQQLRNYLLAPHLRSWPQRLNGALLLSLMPEQYVQAGDEVLVQRLLAHPFSTNGSSFGVYPQSAERENHWLTAYSIWILQRLSEQRYGEYAETILARVDTQKALQAILTEETSANARALALWALRGAQDLNYAEYSEYAKQLLSANSARERLLYLASVHDYPEAERLSAALLAQLQTSGYQSTSGGVYSQTLDRCLVLFSYPVTHPHRLQQAQDLHMQQRERGDFGDVYSNGFCLLALFSEQSSGTDISEIPIVAENKGEGRWEVAAKLSDSPLFARFETHYQELPAIQQGLSLQRQYAVKRLGARHDQEWQSLEPNTQLQIGDRVKVTLKLNAPVAINEIVVRDHVPGGWYVSRSGFSNSFSLYCQYYCYQHIERQQISLYQPWIPAGITELEYYIEVRSSGTFLAPGATAEAPFRGDVRARTDSAVWRVEE